MAKCLTIREAQVCIFVIEDNDNVEISNQLGISRKAVWAYLSSIYKKLGVRNREELRNKLLTIEMLS